VERRAELKALRRWAAAAVFVVVAALAPSVGLGQQDEQWDDGADDPRVQEDGGQWDGGSQWQGGDQRFHEDRGRRFQHHHQRRDGSAMPVPQSGGTRPYWGSQQPYWGTMQPYWGPSGGPSSQQPLHGNTPLNRRGR
jgi:hypothetical protein